VTARYYFTALLLAPSLYCYADDAQPDAGFLEYLAGLEMVDGELMDPMEIDDMLETRKDEQANEQANEQESEDE